MPVLVGVQERVDPDVAESAHRLRAECERHHELAVKGDQEHGRRSTALTSTWSFVHVSRVRLFTFEMWVPNFLCIEAHWTQRKTPWSHEAHRGFLARQSAQWSLPGSLTRARIWRWYRSAAAFADMAGRARLRWTE